MKFVIAEDKAGIMYYARTRPLVSYDLTTSLEEAVVFDTEADARACAVMLSHFGRHAYPCYVRVIDSKFVVEEA